MLTWLKFSLFLHSLHMVLSMLLNWSVNRHDRECDIRLNLGNSEVAPSTIVLIAVWPFFDTGPLYICIWADYFCDFETYSHTPVLIKM